jgi:hypothetical protein
VLNLPAQIECKGVFVRARLGRAPLDVLLTLSGYKHGTIALPGGHRIELGQESDG